MKPGAVVRSGVGAARFRLTGHRMPLNVHWAITRRCNALCTYCSAPIRAVKELDTRELLTVADQLAEAGAVSVALGGGEPLVRDDVGLLVDRLAELGVWSVVETNGHLYRARARELDRVGRLVVALDGRESAHDLNREPGSWRQAMAAVVEATARGLDVRTVTTLTRHNLDDVDAVLDYADTHGFVADFQVLQRGRSLSPGQAERVAPETDALKRTLRALLAAKKAGRRVGPTEKYFHYLLSWDDFGSPTTQAPKEDLHCLAGQLYCAIDADGSLAACPLLDAKGSGPNVRSGFADAFAALRDASCRACTSTALTEYNYLFNLDAPSVLERIKSLGRAGSRRRKGAA